MDIDKTDPRIHLDALVDKLGKVTSAQEGMTEKQGDDIIRYRHVVIAFAGVCTGLFVIGTYYLGVVDKRSVAPTEALDVRVTAIEKDIVPSLRKQLKEVGEDTKEEVRRVSSRVEEGNSLTNKKVDRLDEKLDRILDSKLPPLPPSATIHRRP